jgi:hypothetical protein
MQTTVTNSINHQFLTARKAKHRALKTSIRSAVLFAFGLAAMLVLANQSAHGQADVSKETSAPIVFQAAGPNAASIQSTVDAFRAALGGGNNLNNAGPLGSGRREINWDGGNPAIVATTAPVTPFDTFLNTRGSRFTTPGMGLSQATPSGLATLFNNPSYATIFSTFSPSRLFTPVDSDQTDGLFFVPGTGGAAAATVTGFGAVFTDVDQPNGSRPGKRHDNNGSTVITYFDVNGKMLFSSSVPPSPGDGSLSFFGVVFQDARIASVRITTDEAPGPNDDSKHDIVMMDDFIYGEPQAVR